LLDEFYGVKGFIKVGEIEQELNFPLKVTNKYGSMADKDYFTRRMRVQFDEFLASLNAVEGHISMLDDFNSEMVAFVSEVLGHRAWTKSVNKLQLKRKRQPEFSDYSNNYRFATLQADASSI
jgi:hypothetical protein